MLATRNLSSVRLLRSKSRSIQSNGSTPSSISSSMSFSIGPAFPDDAFPEDMFIVSESEKHAKDLSYYTIEEFKQVLIDSLSAMINYFTLI